MLLALHKNAMADAYAVFLFNDYSQVKQSIQQSMTALKFKQCRGNNIVDRLSWMDS